MNIQPNIIFWFHYFLLYIHLRTDAVDSSNSCIVTKHYFSVRIQNYVWLYVFISNCGLIDYILFKIRTEKVFKTALLTALLKA